MIYAPPGIMAFAKFKAIIKPIIKIGNNIR